MTLTNGDRFTRWMLGLCSLLLGAGVLGALNVSHRLVAVETIQNFLVQELGEISAKLDRIDDRLHAIEKGPR